MKKVDKSKKNICVLGGYYGLLVASKILLSGSHVTVFCKEEEKKKLDQLGYSISFKTAGLNTKQPFKSNIFQKNDLLKFVSNIHEFEIEKFDLIFLCISEHHYSSNNLTQLIKRINIYKRPIISVTNLYPPSYFNQLNFFNINLINKCYYNFDLSTKYLDSKFVAVASPEPQFFNKSDSQYSIRLSGKFRISPFSNKELNLKIHNMLKNFNYNKFEQFDNLPVEFKIYDNLFIPLSKLPMLITGNYRCLTDGNNAISIKQAVYNDLNLSKLIYNETIDILNKLGVKRNSIIPFSMYLKAVNFLDAPSSFAKSVYNGEKKIERVDKLISTISQILNLRKEVIEQVVNFNDQIINNK